MRDVVFLNVIKTFRRILRNNIDVTSDYYALVSELQERVRELDVIVAAYDDETIEPDYRRLTGAVEDLRQALEGVTVPVFVDDAEYTTPNVTPPPPEEAYSVDFSTAVQPE